MGQLFTTIRTSVVSGRYIIGEHAVERLDERGILEWQVVDGISTATVILERPDDLPNPVVEVMQQLADGTPIKAVWSYLVLTDVAKLVTVYFFNR